MENSIYDKNIWSKYFEMMQQTFKCKELEQFKTLGKELEAVVNSYDPNSKQNSQIFAQAQDMATFVMTYALETATFLGGEMYKNTLLKKIDMMSFLSEHTPARIAYNMSEECGEKGLAEKQFLLKNLEGIKKMYEYGGK